MAHIETQSPHSTVEARTWNMPVLQSQSFEKKETSINRPRLIFLLFRVYYIGTCALGPPKPWDSSNLQSPWKIVRYEPTGRARVEEATST